MNNAGLWMVRKSITEEGMEQHMASNHLGHFLLTNLLVPRMVETAKSNEDKKCGRVVIVSSMAHWFDNLELDNLNGERYFDVSYRSIYSFLHTLCRFLLPGI